MDGTIDSLADAARAESEPGPTLTAVEPSPLPAVFRC
jgi:hypothetical protein